MKSSTSTLVAVIQMCSKDCKIQNMEFIREHLNIAGQQGAKICFLPQGFASLNNSPDDTQQNAESLSGKFITELKELALQNNIWLSLGGFQTQIQENETGKLKNSHIIIDDKGNIVSVYEKLHMFDIDIDEKNRFFESQTYQPGNLVSPPVSTPFGKIGLSICYDLRFPELYQILSLQGANIITVPAAFLKQTGEAHWEILLRARAIENQVYIIAAAQTGKHSEKRESYGHSLVIDPWGKVLLDMGQSQGVGYAEIDLKIVDDIRQKMPVQKHIRTDVFKSEFQNFFEPNL